MTWHDQLYTVFALMACGEGGRGDDASKRTSRAVPSLDMGRVFDDTEGRELGRIGEQGTSSQKGRG